MIETLFIKSLPNKTYSLQSYVYVKSNKPKLWKLFSNTYYIAKVKVNPHFLGKDGKIV